MTASLSHRLAAAGYKMTPPRQAVLQALEGCSGHFSVAAVQAEAQTVYPALGRATVYRTLEILTHLGVLRPIYLGDQSVSFCRADGAHHHLICSDCRVIVEFDDCAVDGLQQGLSERFGFEIRGHLLEFYGLCGRCRSAAPGAAQRSMV